jgi:hypothetical protein
VLTIDAGGAQAPVPFSFMGRPDPASVFRRYDLQFIEKAAHITKEIAHADEEGLGTENFVAADLLKSGDASVSSEVGINLAGRSPQEVVFGEVDLSADLVQSSAPAANITASSATSAPDSSTVTCGAVVMVLFTNRMRVTVGLIRTRPIRPSLTNLRQGRGDLVENVGIQ